ncbi:MAG: thiamine-phosphate kinase [Deltaproteobacteria bacterium]|nr:thiamine-phosphate kinase [Deltaproteobacteria bacterium]HCH64300.1 thiamine-phosphate kinase [Deltaproteobacteria bacterium]
MPDDPGEQDPGEQFVIDTILAARPPSASGPVRLDAGDDTAIVDGHTLVTTDTLVEGVHWDQRARPFDVGWKCIAVSVSDIAAMGGAPTWATLSLCLPRPLDANWVRAFARGLGDACAQWTVRLVGGDTTRSPGARVVSITMGGRAEHPLLRSGAAVGHDIWVTGVPGEAAVGFMHNGPGLTALHHPQPPVAFARALSRQQLAGAAMDLSDGLATDLPRLCKASGVGALVDPSALPTSPILRTAKRPLAAQVAFGDDYQLLFTAAPEHRTSIVALANAHQVRATRIGHTTAARTVRLLNTSWPAPEFSHFVSAHGHAP